MELLVPVAAAVFFIALGHEANKKFSKKSSKKAAAPKSQESSLSEIAMETTFQVLDKAYEIKKKLKG